jgi:predicted PurR-regulated permease PerM
VKQSHTFKEYGGGFFLFCLCAVVVFAYIVLRPFLAVFLITLVLAAVTYPLYERIRGWLKGRESLASLFTCLLVVILLIVPGVIILALLAHESIQVYAWVNDKVTSIQGAQGGLKAQILAAQKAYLPFVDFERVPLGEWLSTLAKRVSELLVGWSTAAIGTVTGAVVNFFLVLVTLFFFFKDGPALGRWVLHLIPLPGSLKQDLLQQFRDVSESAFYGSFLSGIVQGTLGGIGFWLVGLPPLVWGVFMAFFSLIPLVGTLSIWGPAAALLLLSGRTGAGLFLIFWGAVVIGMSDNVVRSLVMKGKAELHPLLIFFSLVGGVMAFGFLGLVLGPLAVLLIISMLRAYEDAARPLLDQMDQR